MKISNQSILENIEQIVRNGSENERSILQLTLQAIQLERESGSGYLLGYLGLSGSLIDERNYQHTVQITPFMLNPLGIVHGGITAAIADTTMGTMVNEILPAHQVCVTSEIKVNYIRPGVGVTLFSQAALLHHGQNMCVCECKITNEIGELIVAASGTFFIIGRKDAVNN